MKEFTMFLISSDRSSSMRKAVKGEKETPFPSRASHGLPDISVRDSPNTSPNHVLLPSPPGKTSTPRVYIISSLESASASEPEFYNEVINVLKDESFHVRNGNRTRRKSRAGTIQESSSTRPKFPRNFALAKYDVCVYLFTKDTLADSNCFHDLCTAQALKMPVVFVRDEAEERPEQFAECVSKNCNGCASLSEYIDKYVWDSRDPPKQTVQKRKGIRPNHQLAPLAVRSRPTSTSDLNVRGVDIRKIRRLQSSPEDSDILLFLVDSFKNAIVFNVADKFRCSEKLKNCICNAVTTLNGTNSPFHNGPDCDNTRTQLRGMDQSKADNLLRVPESAVVLATREWGSSSGSISAPPIDNPARDGRFSYDFRIVTPLPIEPKATTYLIFRDKKSCSLDTIRRINYPPKTEEIEELRDTIHELESDEGEPYGSPIQIPDIDLGREINKANDTLESDE